MYIFIHRIELLKIKQWQSEFSQSLIFCKTQAVWASIEYLDILNIPNVSFYRLVGWSVGRSDGLSVIILSKGGKFHFHPHIGALVMFWPLALFKFTFTFCLLPFKNVPMKIKPRWQRRIPRVQLIPNPMKCEKPTSKKK